MDSFWDFFWLMISIFFLMAYLLVLFNVIVDLFRDRETSGVVKAVWVVFLLIVPALTALAYLIVRGKGMAERSIAVQHQAKADVDAYIREVSGASPASEIAAAKQLLDSGAITDAEFATIKAKVLA